jgi:hypothetical protein
MGDFLQPEDPTRPRSVGYGKGHVRNLLKLDTYGEKSSEEARVQREMGMLPPSPNIDRYRHMSMGGSRGSVSTASTASTAEDERKSRPKTTGHHPDSLDVYLPLQPRQGHTVRIQEGSDAAAATGGRGGVMDTNSFAVLGLVAATPEEGACRPTAKSIKQQQQQQQQQRNVVPPGTLGYAGPAINKEDVSLVDAHARGVEYFNGIVTRKFRKQQHKQTIKKERRRVLAMQTEAAKAIEHIDQFEANLAAIRSGGPRPL